MPPQPKDPKIRQRRNRASSRAHLSVVAEDYVANGTDGTERHNTPPLPPCTHAEGWHDLAVAFWNNVWTSPMADQMLWADLDGMYILVDLINRYWHKPSGVLAAEIRMQRQAYGLTPLDRRRLEWQVEQAEDAKDKGARRRSGQPERPTRPDPRAAALQ
jgi:hypothetical protein